MLTDKIIKAVHEDIPNISSQLEQIIDNIALKKYKLKSDAKYYDETTNKWYKDETKTELATDNSPLIKQYIDDLIANKNSFICKLPKAIEGEFWFSETIELTNGIVLHGDNTKMQFTSDVGIRVIDGNDNLDILKSVAILGKSKVNSIAIEFAQKTSGSSQRNVSNVTTFFWDTDIKFLSNSYLISFDKCKISSCNKAIVFPSEITNCGENISFLNCTISSKINCVEILQYCDIKFVNCSFDYFENTLCKIRDRGIMRLYGCHIETDGKIDTPIIDVAASGSLFQMFGGQMIMIDHIGVRNIPHIVKCNSENGDVDCQFYGVTLDDLNTTSNYFSTGNGRVLLNNIHHYEASKTFQFNNNNKNLLADGGFEMVDYNSDRVDMVFVNKCTVTPTTNPMNGGSIACLSDSSVKYSGTKSLQIIKSSGDNTTNASLVICVPVSQANRYNSSLRVKSDIGYGSLGIKFGYAIMQSWGNVTPKIRKLREVKSIFVTSDTIKDWTFYTSYNNLFNTTKPYDYENVFYIEIDITNFNNNGKLWVDEVVISEF